MKFIMTGALWLSLIVSILAQHSLSGEITDENGEPLPGAYVLIDQQGQGTSTDADGFYRFGSLEKRPYLLTIVYLGYQKIEQEVFVDGHTSFDFTLQYESYSAGEVVVLSSWAKEKTPMTYTNLNKEELTRNNLGQDVPYVLRWTPSVVANSDAGTGIGYTGIRIRGSDPTRINVTINGIPLNDAESQGTFWVNLPDFVSSADAVQIQRGAGTSTNGAGAFGGTINLKTGLQHPKPYVELNNTFGSFNTWKHNIQAGSGLLGGKFTLDGRLSRITSDGYIDRARARLHSFYTSAAYWGERSSLQLNIFSGHEITYQAWNGVPAQYINDDDLRTFNTAGMEKIGIPHDNEVDDYQQTHYQLLFKNQLSATMNLNLAAHYTKGQGFFEQYKGNQDLQGIGFPDAPDGEAFDLIRRRWLDNDFYGFTYGLEYQNDKIDAVLGGAWNNYEGRHFGETIWTAWQGREEDPPLYYDNDAEKSDFNIYAKAGYQLNPELQAYLDLQYRRINYTFLGFDNDGQSITQQADLKFFNPKGGFYYDWNENSSAYASFSVAQREPNRNDFTESTPNSRPRSEKMYDTELGYHLKKPGGSFSANLFYMVYDDQLVPTGQLNDVGAATRVNVDDSYRLGLELEGLIVLNDQFSFRTATTLSRNKIKSFTEYIDNWDTGEQETIAHENTDLSFSPDVLASGELSYDVFKKRNPGSKHSLIFSLLGKYVGKQYIDNTSNENTILDPYFFTDFRVEYKLTKAAFFRELGLTLLVRNLLDARYEANAWTYRYKSASYDGRPDDPYTRLEGGDVYNLTGFFPQAGINFLLGVSVKF